MEQGKLAEPPWAQKIGRAVEFQARPSVIPPLWRDDRCLPGGIGQEDLKGNHSYKFIYSRVFAADPNGRNLLIPLVGAGRFELPTPCAQGSFRPQPKMYYFQLLTFQADGATLL